MGGSTKIAWCDSTWNPWIGCTNVSPGCDHCYAEALAKRTGFAKWGNHPRRRTSPAYWKQPLTWNRAAEKAGVRRRVFCASMADVFDNQVDPAWRCDLWDLIYATPELDWLVLTKRPQNIAGMLPVKAKGALADLGDGWPNVWLGTTVEDRTHGRRRAWDLAQIPAVVRFWSVEPLLEDLGDCDSLCLRDTATDGRPAVSWCIVGGESGPGAQPMDSVFGSNRHLGTGAKAAPRPHLSGDPSWIGLPR